MTPRRTPSGGETARLRFCGGCNPGYDRVAAAEKMKRRLLAAGHGVVSADGAAEVVIVFCGCECACADVSGLDRGRVVFITNAGMAEEMAGLSDQVAYEKVSQQKNTSPLTKNCFFAHGLRLAFQPSSFHQRNAAQFLRSCFIQYSLSAYLNSLSLLAENGLR